MSSSLVENFLGIVPVLRFLPKRWSYYSKLSTIPGLASMTKALQELKRDGVTIIPDFLDLKTIDTMQQAIPDIDRFELSPEGDQSRFYRDAHLLEEFKPFFDDERLKSLATSYISDMSIPIRQTIEYRTVGGQVMAFDRMYHMDTWKHRMKAFLYLHDVDETCAPLTYLCRSHRGIWRLPMEAKVCKSYQVGKQGYAVNTDEAYHGCYWPHDVNQLKKTYGLNDLVCTGRAGTLVVFDARGLHKATELKSQHRKVLISYWIHKNHHI